MMAPVLVVILLFLTSPILGLVNFQRRCGDTSKVNRKLRPVCAVGRELDQTITMFNTEVAECLGLIPVCAGFCPCPKCYVQWIERPVCSKRGVTYANEELAKCNKDKVICEGRCPCQ